MANDKPDNFIVRETKQKKGANSPDFWARVQISDETLKGLVAIAKSGHTPEASLSLWQKTGQYGPFLTGSISVTRNQEGPPRRAPAKGGGGSSRTFDRKASERPVRQSRPEPEIFADDDDEAPW